MTGKQIPPRFLPFSSVFSSSFMLDEIAVRDLQYNCFSMLANDFLVGTSFF